MRRCSSPDSHGETGTLYDVLGVLFTTAESNLKNRRMDLSVERPDDATLDRYFAYAERYFEMLRQHFPEMKAFFAAKDYERITAKQRGSQGGNMMFRPIGLEIMTRIIARLTKEMTLEAAVKRTALLRNRSRKTRGPVTSNNGDD